MESYTVILEGKLAQGTGLADFAEAVMDALVDLSAEDPFVFTDAGGPSFRVEVVAKGNGQTDALAAGVQLISKALATVGVETPVLTPAAHTEGLAAA